MSDKKLIMLSLRVSQYELNRIRGLAKIYAGGDVSVWMRWAAFNAERKIIKKKGDPRLGGRPKKKQDMN